MPNSTAVAPEVTAIFVALYLVTANNIATIVAIASDKRKIFANLLYLVRLRIYKTHNNEYKKCQ